MDEILKKYKLDYLVVILISGIIGFVIYEFAVMPYLISKISCSSLVENFDNNRFSLIDLKQLVHHEYNQRCAEMEYLK